MPQYLQKSRIFIRLATLIVAWLAMAFTHELGHIIGGYCSGAKLQDANLWPWNLPYSFFQPDPFPLVTLWSGPIIGTLIPLIFAVISRNKRVWMVAWFCMTANGLYLLIAFVTKDPLLDTARLLDQGASPFTIFAFGLPTAIFGYWKLRTAIIDDFRTTGVEHRGQADDLQ